MLVSPLVSFDTITEAELNTCLVAWHHKMGPLNRPGMEPWFYGLRVHEELVAVVSGSRLVAATAAGYKRAQAMEVSRICAIAPDWCRVVVRLWRNVVFPSLCDRHHYQYAISYQDANEHSGDLYRFDGWIRVAFSHSGTDRRSGREGRDKWIWVWHQDPETRRTMRLAVNDTKSRK